MSSDIKMQDVELDPACYAPYASPRRFITDWTDKLWITRGIGRLGDHYAKDIKVHTCYGETYGFDDVISNSLQKMVAFPNRGGGHDDVIWEARGTSSFVSSHRVFNNATHLGHWTYGPPTGKDWVNRGIAHCLIVDGKVTEEWVIRDEYAVLEHLGLDPFEIARQLAVRSPVLGAEIGSLENAPALSGAVSDPLAVGISGTRPQRFERECARVCQMFEEVWNARLFDSVGDYFDETIVCQTVRLRRVMNLAPYQLEVMKLLAAFPDGKIEVRDIVANYSEDLGLRIGVIWLLRGTYSGSPIYGAVNQAPVKILGASHFELRGDKIIREWRIYDEIAVIAQILKANTTAA
ncbi:ester cyclase [Paraburkholderia nemoris]|uniref:ester cyclase n=1 Tax=Paraburkholderia nemoris TaxID=2793076 RepID=UPI0038BDEF2C